MSESDPSRFDVTIERTFEASRERVWDAWTDPAQVAEWWGPTGFTVPRCELDVRPGGAFRIDMEGPDGTVHPSEGVFEAVDEPEVLVFLTAAGQDEDGNYLFEVRQTATFEEREGVTVVRLDAEVLKAAPGSARYLEGMEDGWRQSLEKLEGVLEA